MFAPRSESGAGGATSRCGTSRPTFRPGDDRIVLNAETELECDGKIDFGDGNDAMSIGDDAEAYLQDFFVMGAGNDTLNIEKGGYVFADATWISAPATTP